MKTFRANYRIPRDKADGSPGFVSVKKGKCPGDYGLDVSDVDAALLIDSDGCPVELTIDEVIRQMWANTPATSHPELWTVNGEPRVEEIERLLKADITQEQRDAAWKTLKDEVTL